MADIHTAKILIVDDEISNVELLQDILIREGYMHYKGLTDPRQVVPTFIEWQPDLILLDIVMPHMDGFAVIEALRKIVSTDDFIPILVLTADVSVQTKKRMLSSGAMDFVTKPFDIVEVILRIRNLLIARSLHKELQKNNSLLEEKVVERAAQILKINELFQLVTHATNDTIYDLNLETLDLWLSEGMENTFGYRKEEIQYSLQWWEERIHPEDHKDLFVSVSKALESKQKIWSGEYRFRRADGSYSWVFDRSFNTFDGREIPVRRTGSMMDITDRKQTEEALWKSKEQFRLISENVTDLIEVLDVEGKRLYNSPSCSLVFGDSEVLLGTDSFEEIHPDDRERVKSVFYETVRTGMGQRAEYRILMKDGRVRDMESQKNVVRNQDGNITKVVIVSRDITEKKLLQQQFLRAQRMESIGTLAGGIAHDLNNVLSPILLSLNILRMKVTDEKSQKMLLMLESTVKHGSDLIKQVLSFARGVEGERTIVQVRHLIDEIGKIIDGTFPKFISFHTDIPGNLPTISADATQLHQVLMNLCVNARDAMPHGGKIEIKAETILLDEQYVKMHIDAKHGPHIVITVTDQGKGIPPSILERIFEPFFTTKEIGKGTGLGLSTVLAIIKSHDGFISVYSQVGKGTSFQVYLPAQEGTLTTMKEENGQLHTGNGELILVVDDEVSIREITKMTLETYGYSVITAADGTEAVVAYATHGIKIALVITDMMMPYMDGVATIRAIQKLNPFSRFILVSGLKQNTDSLPQESVVFLQKPYTSEKLLKIISEQLSINKFMQNTL